MVCQKCGKENPDSNNFCGGCGAALKVTESTEDPHSTATNQIPDAGDVSKPGDLLDTARKQASALSRRIQTVSLSSSFAFGYAVFARSADRTVQSTFFPLWGNSRKLQTKCESITTWEDATTLAFGTAVPPNAVAVIEGDDTNYVLLDNGQVLSKDGDLVFDGMVDLAVSELGLLGLREDGSVEQRIPEPIDVHDVVGVAMMEYGCAFLHRDGTVLSVEAQPDGTWKQRQLDWTQIIAIAGFSGTLYGLRADGTLLSTNPQDMPIPGVAAITPMALIKRGGMVLFRPDNLPWKETGLCIEIPASEMINMESTTDNTTKSKYAIKGDDIPDAILAFDPKPSQPKKKSEYAMKGSDIPDATLTFDSKASKSQTQSVPEPIKELFNTMFTHPENIPKGVPVDPDHRCKCGMYLRKESRFCPRCGEPVK